MFSFQDGVITPVSPEPTDPEQASEDVRTNGYHGSEEAVGMETEEEKIQALMGRSDTAVIFPEPVSDHEEGNITTENEGQCSDTARLCVCACVCVCVCVCVCRLAEWSARVVTLNKWRSSFYIYATVRYFRSK